jgi:hypothetical protein
MLWYHVCKWYSPVFLQKLLNQVTNFYGRRLVFSSPKSNEYHCLSYVLIRIIFNNNMAIRRYGGSGGVSVPLTVVLSIETYL